MSVREGHPLKQGLKLIEMILLRPGIRRVREGHPLKQGLKQFPIDEVPNFWERSGRTSTKTRIETQTGS